MTLSAKGTWHKIKQRSSEQRSWLETILRQIQLFMISNSSHFLMNLSIKSLVRRLILFSKPIICWNQRITYQIHSFRIFNLYCISWYCFILFNLLNIPILALLLTFKLLYIVNLTLQTERDQIVICY